MISDNVVVWVSLVLDLLAGGSTTKEILDNDPGLVEEGVLACIAYRAESPASVTSTSPSNRAREE